MSEISNSLINEHCIGYTFQDKCRPYQEDVLSHEEDSLLSGDSSDGSSGQNKQSRVKSMLVLGASANRANSHINQYSSILGKVSSPLLAWAATVIEVLGKVVASVTVSGTIYWILIEYHCS